MKRKSQLLHCSGFRGCFLGNGGSCRDDYEGIVETSVRHSLFPYKEVSVFYGPLIWAPRSFRMILGVLNGTYGAYLRSIPHYSNSSLIWSYYGLYIPTIVPCGTHYWVGDLAFKMRV